MYTLSMARFMVSFGVMNLCMTLGKAIGKTHDEKSGWLLLGMFLICTICWLDDLRTKRVENSYLRQSFSRSLLGETFSMYLMGFFAAICLFLVLLSKFTVVAICTSLLLLIAAAYLRLAKTTTVVDTSELDD